MKVQHQLMLFAGCYINLQNYLLILNCQTYVFLQHIIYIYKLKMSQSELQNHDHIKSEGDIQANQEEETLKQEDVKEGVESQNYRQVNRLHSNSTLSIKSFISERNVYKFKPKRVLNIHSEKRSSGQSSNISEKMAQKIAFLRNDYQFWKENLNKLGETRNKLFETYDYCIRNSAEGCVYIEKMLEDNQKQLVQTRLKLDYFLKKIWELEEKK